MKYTIHIIESPSSNDLLIGRNEGDALGRFLHLSGVPYTYYLATSVDTFDIALDSIKSAMKIEMQEHQKFLCHLHISCHGSLDGLELTDGDCIEWESLDNRFAGMSKEIGPVKFTNDVFPKDLTPLCVCLSSCSAFKFFLDSSLNKKNYQFLVGPNEDIDWCDALLGYAVFYRNSVTLVKNHWKSIVRMNAALGLEHEPIFESDENPRITKLRQTDAFRNRQTKKKNKKKGT